LCSLKKKLQNKKKNVQCGDVDSSYNYLKSFDFIFILDLMKEITGTTYLLCQALQNKKDS